MGPSKAGIGSSKRRTQPHRLPGVWTSADAGSARIEANASSCPGRLQGLTPDEVWRTRCLPPSDERDAFLETVVAFRAEARAERGLLIQDELTRQERVAGIKWRYVVRSSRRL
jgi:hypothetical protein